MLVADMNAFERARFTAFAVKISLRLLAANHAMQGDLRALGLDPRRVLRLAKSKQVLVFEELWAAAPGSKSRAGELASLGLEALANALWPEKSDGSVRGRMRAFMQALREDGVASVPTTIVPVDAVAAMEER